MEPAEVLYKFTPHSRCPTESRKSHVTVAPDNYSYTSVSDRGYILAISQL